MILSDYLDKVGTLTENQNKAMDFFKKASQPMSNNMILALLYMYADGEKKDCFLSDCGNMKFIVRDGFHKLDPLTTVAFYESLVDFYDGGEEPREGVN